ncbi:RNA_pol_Rpb2_6 domain-containing protein [Trichonephila clavipes]|nr:RNA_pol_Rpb2_6 domain-containing protein [Trichonephila clavipes]
MQTLDQIDLAIRHQQVGTFEANIPTVSNASFQEVDIGRGFFIICGFLRHLPYFLTNDLTHTHMVQKKMVRVFTYDALDRDKELSNYVTDCPPKKRGDMIVVGNDGSESIEQVDFFYHCPHRTDAAAYMAQVYQQNRFDIDSLVNKIVVSSGHLFTKLFVKYLYAPLRKGNWSLIKSKTALVVKSIETGCLLHVLSRKTVYFKEGKSAGKMTVTPHESHREIGSNGEVFVEKTIGCYREVNMQTYPLNPYLSYLIVRQMSNKVKHNSVPSFHDSYLGFLCILGCFETKNGQNHHDGTQHGRIYL